MERAQKHSEDTELVVSRTTAVYTCWKLCLYRGKQLQRRNVLDPVSPLGRSSMKSSMMQDTLTMLYQTEKIFWPLANRWHFHSQVSSVHSQSLWKFVLPSGSSIQQSYIIPMNIASQRSFMIFVLYLGHYPDHVSVSGILNICLLALFLQQASPPFTTITNDN